MVCSLRSMSVQMLRRGLAKLAVDNLEWSGDFVTRSIMGISGLIL